MAVLKLKSRELTVLDIDLENRPLTYLGSDFTTDEITAMSWSFVGEDVVSSMFLWPNDTFVDDHDVVRTRPEALNHLASIIRSADMITGHYIRRHDLPLLNGALMEAGCAALPELLTQDTKMDLRSRKGISASQENLSAMFDLVHPKQHMSQIEWRRANRLSTEGIKEARRRVVGDVWQHKELRLALLRYGLLRGPSLWSP